jgi:hypothetical protein
MAADSFKVKPSTDPLAIDLAVDIGSDGKEYQLEQLAFGPDGGAKVMVDDVDGFRLPTRSYVRRSDLSVVASVAIGASLSGAVDIRGYRFTGIIVPSTFDGTIITFQVSADGTNYFALYDATNTLVQMTVAASRAYAVWAEVNDWSYVKIATVSSQTTTTTDFVLQLRS